MKWIVRGCSKLARGNVHPCEVIRALMIDLENIGADVRGADVDRKLAETQLCTVLTVNPYIPSNNNERMRGNPLNLLQNSGSGSGSGSGSASRNNVTVVPATVTNINKMGAVIPTSIAKNESINVETSDSEKIMQGIERNKSEEKREGNFPGLESLKSADERTSDCMTATLSSTASHSSSHSDSFATSGTGTLIPIPIRNITSVPAAIVPITISSVSPSSTSSSTSSSTLSLAAYTLYSSSAKSGNSSLAQSLFEYSEDADGKHSISRSASAVRPCIITSFI